MNFRLSYQFNRKRALTQWVLGWGMHWYWCTHHRQFRDWKKETNRINEDKCYGCLSLLTLKPYTLRGTRRAQKLGTPSQNWWLELGCKMGRLRKHVRIFTCSIEDNERKSYIELRDNYTLTEVQFYDQSYHYVYDECLRRSRDQTNVSCLTMDWPGCSLGGIVKV